jgi:hypothetical protein
MSAFLFFVFVFGSFFVLPFNSSTRHEETRHHTIIVFALANAVFDNMEIMSLDGMWFRRGWGERERQIIGDARRVVTVAIHHYFDIHTRQQTIISFRINVDHFKDLHLPFFLGYIIME